MGRGGSKGYSKVIWPGFSYKPAPRHIAKVGRNDPCPCKSGKKYKDCHEAEGASYLEKLIRQEDRARWHDARERTKAAHPPWYTRLLRSLGFGHGGR